MGPDSEGPGPDSEARVTRMSVFRSRARPFPLSLSHLEAHNLEAVGSEPTLTACV